MSQPELQAPQPEQLAGQVEPYPHELPEPPAAFQIVYHEQISADIRHGIIENLCRDAAPPVFFFGVGQRRQVGQQVKQGGALTQGRLHLCVEGQGRPLFMPLAAQGSFLVKGGK